MIYEYALDPALVATWHDRKEFLFFEEKFGVSTRRIVSTYPKRRDWLKMVTRCFESGEHAEDQSAKMRLGALLTKLMEEAARRRNTFKEIPLWVERAERECDERPFRAILTNVEGRRHPAVLRAAELIANGNSLWNVPALPAVTRKVREMADAAAPVLRASRRIIFVDPYFDPTAARFTRPVEAMIERVFDSRDASEGVAVELHTGIERFFRNSSLPQTPENELLKCEEFLQRCQENLRHIIPLRAKLKIVVWKERLNGQVLHNRFVLTDIAGILFPHGLDESLGQHSESVDNLVLLPKEQLTDCWRQYANDSCAFDCVGAPVEIVGEKA
jgi:hypothetical protein